MLSSQSRLQQQLRWPEIMILLFLLPVFTLSLVENGDGIWLYPHTVFHFFFYTFFIRHHQLSRAAKTRLRTRQLLIEVAPFTWGLLALFRLE